jgi:hypothetical protein
VHRVRLADRVRADEGDLGVMGPGHVGCTVGRWVGALRLRRVDATTG